MVSFLSSSALFLRRSLFTFKSLRSVAFGAATCTAVLCSVSALAHTPYLLPTSFEPVRGQLITLDATFTEAFFAPEIAFDKSEFIVRGPQGETTSPDTTLLLKTRTVVEHKLERKGSYRISTGERFGRVFKLYQLDGERHSSEDPSEPLPEGAELLAHFQSVSRADTYVTYEVPDNAALTSDQHGLEIVPVTHPNDAYAGSEFKARILFDGKPIATDSEVDIFGSTLADGGHDPLSTLTTKNDGLLMWPADVPAGTYLIRVRHRVDAPAGAKAPQYSYTTTLTLQLFEDI